MNVFYLLLCVLFGGACAFVLCAAAGDSGKVMAAPDMKLYKKAFLPGNLAAPMAIAVCSLCAVALGSHFGILHSGKANQLQLCLGLVFCCLLALFGLWDDTLRIFGGSHIGLPFGLRQVVLALLCAVYTFLQSKIGGTVLVFPTRNFNLGVWYTPVCTLLCMAVLLGVQALILKPTCCHVLVLFAAAGVLPLFGKLENHALSVPAAVTAGVVCTLFWYSCPVSRVYMGSCTNLFLGGIVCCLCVQSLPVISAVCALPLMAVGLLAALLLLFPRAAGAKRLFNLYNQTCIDICMAAGFLCAAAAGIFTIYL